MASIRRTLSPVPRPGARSNGEASLVSSPLSKSSSSVHNPLHSTGSGPSYSYFDSLDYGLYRVHSLITGFFSKRTSRSTFDRSKPKGHVWKRSLLQFLACFVVGVFVGLTPFGSMNSLGRLMPKHQTLFYDMIPSSIKYESSLYKLRNASLENNTISSIVGSNTVTEGSKLEIRKLLIIVTPTHNRPFQAYYLHRLAQTLKLVPSPFLWIVVDMRSQSSETAEILRNTGVMYRHLVCNKNVTDMKNGNVHQRNVALEHIETHRLDGIVYFADDSNVYSLELFAQLREIRRFGTWKVAKLSGGNFVNGPVCNGSEVIGWKTDELNRRFHADVSGFAFNSTILWDQKRWHRLSPEPIRQLDTVKDISVVSAFIEQIVEDERQMEGLLGNCSRIMVWSLPIESSAGSYPRQWSISSRSTEKNFPH